MKYIKSLIFLIFTVISSNANMIEDLVYVENKSSEDQSIKEEFFIENTEFYTISIGTLTLQRHDPIDFFKTYNMQNALAYKFGKNKEFARVISGVYKTGTEAKNAIKNLDPRLQRNKPYSAKITRHQKLYKEDNKLLINSSLPITPKSKTISKKIKSNLVESDNSIYVSNNENSKNLKKEFLKNGSKYYSIALGSISLSKNSIKNFFKTYDVGDSALAHIYGKNKDKARIIYGVYKTKKEAKEAIKGFSQKLKKNNPYSQRMKNFQSFYKKSFPEGLDKNIIELKINDKKNIEKKIKTKLSNEIKIVMNKEEKATKKEIEKKEFKPKVPKLSKQKKINNKVEKKQETKKIKKVKIKSAKEKKENLNKSRFVKYSELEDVFFLESNGNFNILNEVFLNDGSSFYTVDLGELDLSKISIEEFFIENRMEDNSLAYKYGNNKEYGRAIYGAYETKEEALKAIDTITVDLKKESLKVSNIKNHQTLYKEFHKSIKKSSNKSRIVNSSFSNESSNKDIVFTDSTLSNNLIDEFSNRDSNFYTITLITFLKEEMNVEKFLSIHNLRHDVLAYSIGSVNNYYRVIYGLYDSSKEAKEALKDLSFELRKNVPYISRIKTNQKKFESYNNRVLEEQIQNSKKIKF